jgi:hypothetical protein
VGRVSRAGEEDWEEGVGEEGGDEEVLGSRRGEEWYPTMGFPESEMSGVVSDRVTGGIER